MMPDIVFDYKSGPVIIDTKWKELDPLDRRKLGVAQSDVYQMLAYGHGYSKHGAKPRLILLYPHHASLGGPEGILRKWVTSGSEMDLLICTVDLSERKSPQDWKQLLGNVTGTVHPSVHQLTTTFHS
ncbi:hypothetical protein NBRC116589_13680 [Ruegeria sp. HU-ET01832]